MTLRIGPYAAVERPGRGHRAAGSVLWRGEDERTGESVLLVVLPAGEAAAVSADVAALAEIRHPHLLTVDRCRVRRGTCGGCLTLAARWAAVDLLVRNGPLTAAETLTVLIPVASALATVHDQQIRHGGVGAGSIWFDDDGRPQLGAPAIASIAARNQRWNARRQPGCRARGGPRRADSSGTRPGPAADIFSLGSVALLCLTGKSAWPADDPADVLIQSAAGVWPDPPDGAAPAALLDLIRAMLSRSPDQRPSAADAAQRLSAVGRPAPISVRSKARPGRRVCRSVARCSADGVGLASVRTRPRAPRPPRQRCRTGSSRSGPTRLARAADRSPDTLSGGSGRRHPGGGLVERRREPGRRARLAARSSPTSTPRAGVPWRPPTRPCWRTSTWTGRPPHRPTPRDRRAGGPRLARGRRAARDRQRDAGRRRRTARRAGFGPPCGAGPAAVTADHGLTPARTGRVGGDARAGRSRNGSSCSPEPPRATGSPGSGPIPDRPFRALIPVTVGPRSYRDPMRMLHTSDWHLGRTFHGQSLLADQESVLGALADLAAAHSGGCRAHLRRPVRPGGAVPGGGAVRHPDPGAGSGAAGISIVAISGNHDSAPRLGAFADFLAAGGLHLRTAAAAVGEPVLLADAHGPVAFYPVPYLEPDLARGLWELPAPPATSRCWPAALGAGPGGSRRAPGGYPVGRAGARLRRRRDGRWVRAVHRRRRSGVGHRRSSSTGSTMSRSVICTARRPSPTGFGTRVRRCRTRSPRPGTGNASGWSISMPPAPSTSVDSSCR